MFGVSAASGSDSAAQARECTCRTRVNESVLHVDAGTCPGDGRLAAREGCRAAIVDALDGRTLSAIAVSSGGRERTYRGRGLALFLAAGAFARAVTGLDDRLATLARRDPLAAAREATGRAGPVAERAEDAGLAEFAAPGLSYESLLRPRVGLAWSIWRVVPAPPPGSRLDGVRDLDTGATARLYSVPGRETRAYHLDPPANRFDAETTGRLETAYERLASASEKDRPRDPRRAVRAVGAEADPEAPMWRVLRKHTRDCGLLADCFADPSVSDVFVTAPAARNPLRVRLDGETLETNVYLTADGMGALASRFRRESGRGFSRAEPTLAAATRIGDRRVRVAGITEPISDGEAFAFRAHDRAVWTLPGLIGNGTLTARAAGLLSVAVERGAAILLAGPRGSGKTTTLGALLWELPEAVRTVLIEDAPELPVAALQDAGRDVQALRAGADDPLEPAGALRSALRLGDGALVVGEVRGEEAGVLYEAMRVGANSEAVMGTIHGDGARSVLERVVSDLGVPASSFAATDLVVTLETTGTGAATSRRVNTVEEVLPTDPVEFAPLFDRTGDGLSPTGRLDRGNSRVVATLTPPEETYADTRQAIDRRGTLLADLADTDRTGPGAVTAARVDRDR